MEFKDLLPDLDGTGDEELHALIERAHQIELLTQHPGWPLFRDYVISLTTAHQNYVLSGACKNLDEYRERTGIVKGLRSAVEAPATLLRQVSNMQSALSER